MFLDGEIWYVRILHLISLNFQAKSSREWKKNGTIREVNKICRFGRGAFSVVQEFIQTVNIMENFRCDSFKLSSLFLS